MSDIKNLVIRYLASWNETDPARRTAEIAELWTEDAAYTDPMAAVRGRAAIDAVIGAVQAQFPGLVLGLLGEVDAHHDVVRFTWGMGPAGAEPIVVGFDVAVLREGRFERVLGFLDKVPA